MSRFRFLTDEMSDEGVTRFGWQKLAKENGEQQSEEFRKEKIELIDRKTGGIGHRSEEKGALVSRSVGISGWLVHAEFSFHSAMKMTTKRFCFVFYLR